MPKYAKVVVDGSPITKSNFKLHNNNGRAILPYNTGKNYDKYALYEQEIAYVARVQNPNIVFDESLIAILKVFYKSEKRHPDTINISKSIFDGIEKSGLIVNDAQIRRIVIEEFYDKENPRFELYLYPESTYSLSYSPNIKEKKDEPILYSSLTRNTPSSTKKKKTLNESNSEKIICEVCNKQIKNNDYIKANKGKTKICKACFSKLF